MLIRGAEILGTAGLADLRIEGATIAAIGTLEARPGEPVIEANGGALLPGLHDHHIHLAGLAARRSSVECGPPYVNDEGDLASAIAAVQTCTGWIRGIGFHESVTGDQLPDRTLLDRLSPDRPLRIQHRTGRMWFLNTPALDILLDGRGPPPGMERIDGRWSGRLFDEDAWLQHVLAGTYPALAETSQALAAMGLTGVTDMTPRNDSTSVAALSTQYSNGDLLQSAVVAGSLALDASLPAMPGITVGPAKLHLHEASLPDPDACTAFVRAAHAQGRSVAVHCVTEVELVFALAAFEAAGTRAGDRIEHVSVASCELVGAMADLGLSACVQPQFVRERGDRYLLDVEAQYQPDLYRLRTLAQAGLPLSGGSDAPYVSADPWSGMAAAVNRRTLGGATIGAQEAVTPEMALSLWLADPMDFSRQRRIAPGELADLCVLDRPWTQARERLSSSDVVSTIAAGRLVHQRIDKTPLERPGRTQPSA